jgi:hypothetical protein
VGRQQAWPDAPMPTAGAEVTSLWAASDLFPAVQVPPAGELPFPAAAAFSFGRDSGAFAPAPLARGEFLNFA